MASWTSTCPTRISLSYRAVCEARTALEEARALLTGEGPGATATERSAAPSHVAERYREDCRRYNEPIRAYRDPAQCPVSLRFHPASLLGPPLRVLRGDARGIHRRARRVSA